MAFAKGLSGGRLPGCSTTEGGADELKQEDGIIKYGIAWMLGVPVSLLILVFLVSRGC